jgi:hypothetical protein
MNMAKNIALTSHIAAVNYGLVAFIVALPTMVVLYRWLL